jgi:hypothetical protein
LDDRTDEVDSQIVAFRARKDLVAAAEAAAAAEGITKSDVVRRATIRELVRHGWLARPADFRREP